MTLTQDEDLDRFTGEARDALTAIRTRLQQGRTTAADHRALIEFIDGALEAQTDDDDFVVFVMRSAVSRMGSMLDEERAAMQRLDALMHRCREEHREPTYADLVAVRGDVPSNEKVVTA